ncbi:MAG: ATP-binding cassette domain-containing protein [Ilumatobacteraceae bacterium]
MTALDISELVVEYVSGGYTVRPIDNLNLRAERGELIVLLGPSGSGKTTLLSCLGGILRPTSGRIVVDDQEITTLGERELERYRRTTVGFVFQSFNLIPSLSARENVAVPLLLNGTSRREAVATADALLTRVGLADRLGHKPAQLSGGQQQRVAIARGLIRDPALLLADEPTANLDYISAEAVIALLRGLRDDGRLIVVSTHDSRLVPIADRVVRMAEDADPSDAEPITVSYTSGETIFRQGDRSDLVYTVESGEVDVIRVLADGGEELITTVGPGQYFGELGPMLGFPRSATVRARTDVELTAYGVRRFRKDVVTPHA